MARTNAEIEVRGQAVQQLEWNKRTDGPDMFVGPVYKTQPNQTHIHVDSKQQRGEQPTLSNTSTYGKTNDMALPHLT